MKTKTILLKKADLQKLKKVLPLWECNAKNTQISRIVTFKNHIDALVLILRITIHAQVLNHHPEIVFSYKKIKITLTTHDAKGLTVADVTLAKKIDTLTAVDK